MNSDSQKTKDAPDWRNTLYQFHNKAVEKYKLKPREIAIYTTLFSKVKRNGKIQMGNAELMRKSGISNKESFKKSRDKLRKARIIKIIKKGNVYSKCTVYRITLMGPPSKPPSKEKK